MRSIPAFAFDAAALDRLADARAGEFVNNAPFPHIVIDDFLPADVAAALAAEYPGPKDIAWSYAGPGDTMRTERKDGDKMACWDETQFPPLIRHVMHEFNSATFLRFLEKLTGIADLIPDPSFNECGLHSTGQGGRLMIHTDMNRHPLAGPQQLIHQRINAIYYVNPDWKEEYKGHLELWDLDTKSCAKKVAPIDNRLIIFDTGTRSLHGHSEALACPADRRRNSMAVYYYVLQRPTAKDYTGFQPDVTWLATTPEDHSYQRRKRLKDLVWKFVPPIVRDGYNVVLRAVNGDKT